MLYPARPRWADHLTAAFLAIVLPVLAGCDPTQTGNLTAALPGYGSISTPLGATLSGTAVYTEAESNDAFDQAEAIGMGDNGQAVLDGSLSGISDVDVYYIGPAEEGDRIELSIDTSISAVSLGVFDQDGSLLELFRVPGRYGVLTYQTYCRDTFSAVYVVITGLDGSSAVGDYSLGFKRTAGTAPAAQPQVVLLNFDGAANVSIAGTTAINIPAFDAANIDSRYAGQTSVIRAAILKNLQEAYSGLNVTFVPSDQAGSLSGVYSTIHFGTYNPALLGLADSVDSYNTDRDQAAIVYADTFSLFMALNPSVDEIAMALSNTTAHETGHLLGLWHTHDTTNIMDITASARQMLRRQMFHTSKLHRTVLPIGNENEANLLQWAVGGILKYDSTNLRIVVAAEDDLRPDFAIDRHMLSTALHCGGH